MVGALQSMGIEVVQWHKEAAPGQYEIATGPGECWVGKCESFCWERGKGGGAQAGKSLNTGADTFALTPTPLSCSPSLSLSPSRFPPRARVRRAADALTAADRLVQTKEAVCAVAARHGLAATFVPKPFPDQAGSGMHVHLSLWGQDGRSAMCAADGPPSWPPELYGCAGASFFAGVLRHLPGLLPFTSPSCGPDWGSYARLRPGCWAGAFACWGWDNREAPLRATRPRPDDPESTNVELKATDGTCNPYVALAAVVCAGMLGLSSRAELPPPVSGSPEAAPAEAGVSPLPADLASAVAAFEADEELKAAVVEGLGADLLRAYFAVRAGEAEANPGLADVLLRY